VAVFLLLLALAAPAYAQAGFDPFNEATIDERPGAQIPLDQPFTNARGQPTTLRALADGKPILLAPVLHNCPNICGVTLAGIAQAIDAQSLKPGRDFTFIAFGIDPKEGPEAAAGDLARLRQKPAGAALGPVSALVGAAPAVHAVTDALGYRYAWDDRIGQYAHIAAVAVLTPDGRLSSWLYGLTPEPDDLSEALTDAKAGDTGSWGEQLLLLCFHYDPNTGRYTVAIEKVLKLAGFLTVAGLAVLVWRLRRRHA
jgi:protein SCO1/2